MPSEAEDIAYIVALLEDLVEGLLPQQESVEYEPLHIKIYLSEEELTALMNGAALRDEDLQDYARNAMMSIALLDVLKKDAPPARTIDDLKMFCRVMGHADGDSLWDGGYKKALNDLLFWIAHPEIIMHELLSEEQE